MFKIITSYLGMSSLQYYEMTPREIILMLEGFYEKHKTDIEFIAIANKIAIINAMGKKNYKVFPDSEKRQIDKTKKREILEELKQIFS